MIKKRSSVLKRSSLRVYRVRKERKKNKKKTKKNKQKRCAGDDPSKKTTRWAWPCMRKEGVSLSACSFTFSSSQELVNTHTHTHTKDGVESKKNLKKQPPHQHSVINLTLATVFIVKDYSVSQVDIISWNMEHGTV